MAGRCRCETAPQSAGPGFANYGMALQAALDGVGVAIGLRPYVEDDIAMRCDGWLRHLRFPFPRGRFGISFIVRSMKPIRRSQPFATGCGQASR